MPLWGMLCEVVKRFACARFHLRWCDGCMTSTWLERSTKIVLLLSIFVAGLFATQATGSRSELPWVCGLALVGSYVGARYLRSSLILDHVVMQGWLVLAYMAPGLVAYEVGGFLSWDLSPWYAGVTGAVLATADPTRWHLPPVWRTPLAAWAVVIALSWPVVWLRELDFMPSLVATAEVTSNRLGVRPTNVNLWMLTVVLTHGIGLLWVDWLFATFSRGQVARFQRVVLLPLALGCVASWLVAAYQSLIDISFLNLRHWVFYGRASGLSMDANPFGMMAAVWGAIAVALVFCRARNRLRMEAILGLAGLLLVVSWYGLWISGSRSSMMAGAVVLCFILRWGMPAALTTGRRTLVALFAIAFVAAATVLVIPSADVTGPWTRLRSTLPSASFDSVVAFLVEMWERDGYGRSAVAMIADFPLVGVGVGTFHALVPDFAFQLGYPDIPGDNAQNWFRHQFAEFGLLGSVGWIVWVGMFLWTLARGRVIEGEAEHAGLVRGALVALGVASLVGMPTQEVSLAFTFWALVFWYVQLVVIPAGGLLVRRELWIGVWLLACVHLVGFAYASSSDLRVPFRAKQANWDYGYGFYGLEQVEDGQPFRWTTGRAVVTMEFAGDVMEVTAWIRHPDARKHPVDLKLWLDGELLLDRRQESGESLTMRVVRQPGQDRVVLEAWVSRTWSPVDYGGQDRRALGTALSWGFVDGMDDG